MRHIKSILELRYSDVPEVFQTKNRLYFAITGQKNISPSFVEPVQVLINDQKAKVVIEPNRVSFSLEDTTFNRAAEFFATIFERINAELNLKQAMRFGFRNIFVHECTDSFEDIASNFKDKFFVNGPLINKATDYGLPLTYKVGDLTIGFIAGPMKGDQLKAQYIEFDHENLPDVCYLVDLDASVQNTSLSKRNILTTLKDMQQAQKDIAKEYFEALGVENV